MKCTTISFVKCTFVLNTVQKDCCVTIGLEILCKISFHTFARLTTTSTAKTGFLREKKKQLSYDSKMFFFCGKHQTMCIGWIASQVCSVYGVFSSESPVNYYSVSVFLDEKNLWVARAGRCVFVWSVITCLPPPPPKHTTQRAIMLLALCGDLQYRCVTGPVWDCLFFFHI